MTTLRPGGEPSIPGRQQSAAETLTAIQELTRGGPAVDLLPQRPSLVETVLSWWTPRRLAVMAVLWPLTAAIVWGLAGPVRSAGTIAVVSFGVALSLTTYTPAPVQTLRQVLGSPCASVGGVLAPLCAVSALTRPGAHVTISLALILFGLTQRFLGSEACGLPTPRRG